jgi:hypothetical protein
LQVKFAKVLNGSAYSVAGLNGTDALRRAGEDYVAGMQLE